jgi:hypothetical protein
MLLLVRKFASYDCSTPFTLPYDYHRKLPKGSYADRPSFNGAMSGAATHEAAFENAFTPGR